MRLDPQKIRKLAALYWRVCKRYGVKGWRLSPEPYPPDDDYLLLLHVLVAPPTKEEREVATAEGRRFHRRYTAGEKILALCRAIQRIDPIGWATQDLHRAYQEHYEEEKVAKKIG